MFGLKKDGHSSKSNLRKQERTASLGREDRASRSASKKRTKHFEELEDTGYVSPRRKLYEAKFEKYIANKENKKLVDKKLESMKKEDFERYI